MSVVPRDLVSKIQFYEDHDPVWSSHATQIGTTSTEVAGLATKTAAARAAYAAQQVAQNAAKDATLTLKLAVDAMAITGSDIIKKIRAKAATDGDGVYALASLPAPASPTPVGAPGTPSNFKALLNPDGSLKLSWKCVNPPGATGTIYSLARRVGATGAFVAIAVTGTKSYTDATLPAGVANVTYQITAARSTATGTAAQFVVNFGTTAGGEMTASVASAPRLAA